MWANLFVVKRKKQFKIPKKGVRCGEKCNFCEKNFMISAKKPIFVICKEKELPLFIKFYRTMKKILCVFLSAALMLGISGCGSMSNTAKGGLLGGGGGAAIGAGIGALIGKGKGAAIGAAIGAAAGTTAGILIGKKMDKQAKELAQIAGAQVDTITDQNNLKAIKVTFDGGILFATGKSALNQTAKNSLSEFATSLQNNPQTNVQIYGHTDNTGSLAVNQKLSKERANSVLNYLMNSGVAASRMVSEGFDYQYPVASNDTEAGRAQNRRVEIYISANEEMVKEANAGTLQ